MNRPIGADRGYPSLRCGSRDDPTLASGSGSPCPRVPREATPRAVVRGWEPPQYLPPPAAQAPVRSAPPLPTHSRWGPRRSRQCCAQGTPGQHRLAVVASVAFLLALLFALPAGAAPVNEEQVREIASLLRCVVCQNLSVADSPSETANQMRQIIRERLANGETREQVQEYFVSKYGEWILLSPPRRGFNWLVWGLPFAGLLAGFAAIAVIVRRWSRPRKEEPSDVVDPSYRERVRRELQELEP